MVVGIIIMSILCTLFHFTYINSKFNKFVAHFFTDKKKKNLSIDIISFYALIITSKVHFCHISTHGSLGYFYNYVGNLETYIVFILYIVFTLLIVKNLAFRDSITNKYCPKGHSEFFLQ